MTLILTLGISLGTTLGMVIATKPTKFYTGLFFLTEFVVLNIILAVIRFAEGK